MDTSFGRDTAEFKFFPSKQHAKAVVDVDCSGMTHQGKVRRNNEDHFFTARFGRFMEVLQTNLSSGDVPPHSQDIVYGMVVADGVGGSAAGEEASRLAIVSLIDLVLQTPDWIFRTDDDDLSEEVMKRAIERYERINQTLVRQGDAAPQMRGLSTTLTMACSLGTDLFIAHIGDSRTYLLRDGQLKQLTWDHTVAQSLLDHGLIDHAEAAPHRLRHVLTQCLGGKGSQIQPHVTRWTLRDKDRLLLCTDGLTEMVPNDRIRDLLQAGESAAATCQRLVDEALAGGGRDNVTVVVAEYSTS